VKADAIARGQLLIGNELYFCIIGMYVIRFRLV